ncbi:MAG TPA: DOMON-like domain-containing protein [Sphingomicrobium sp.]|jgi:hypothetical protein|nr:DOMON-like domain-containing protein [Sphingomicrobium sp.]
MRAPLLLHPDSTSGAAEAIMVEVERTRDRKLRLRFAMTGALKRLLLPKRASERPSRVDELWRHTCFEAFIGIDGSEVYFEFNLAPSRDWACYRFDAYRSAMTSPREALEPQIDCWVHLPRPSDRVRGIDADYAGRIRNYAQPFFDLSAEIDLRPFHELTLDKPWRLGLSAVVEERNGNKSYWALAHPSGPADFHHRDCFAFQLPAARLP